MRDKPLVIVAEHLSGAAARWLAERGRVRSVAAGAPEFGVALREAEGLVVRTGTIVDRALLGRAPRLRVVGRAGVGLDNIDVGACRERGIEVVYTPDASTQAVVEYVFLLVLQALRPVGTLAAPVDGQGWAAERAGHVGRRQLDELTLGILGLGRIGRRVAEVGRAVGMTVRYHDLLDIPPDERGGAVPTPVADLFRTSDVLSLHVDGRASNRQVVGRSRLETMKTDVLLLNTSRGFVVDNVALARFLRSHPGAQAHLDVHDPEPFDDAYPLLGLPNAKLYPHLGARTTRAEARMGEVVHDVVAVLEGRPPRHPAPAAEPAE